MNRRSSTSGLVQVIGIVVTRLVCGIRVSIEIVNVVTVVVGGCESV